MFLNSPTLTLEVSSRVKHQEGFHMAYASSGNRKCFERGDVGHKRITCPHKQRAESGSVPPADPDPGGPKGQAGGERLLPQLSCRGRVLVANNLVTLTLWHRLIVLPPSRSLIEELQRIIVVFFLVWTTLDLGSSSVLCTELYQ